MGLVIDFILGGASKDLVNALVGDLLLSVITFFIHGDGWKEATVSLVSIVLSVGHFAGALLDFVIIALIVFIIMGKLKTNLK